jgi:hypothetical protein
MKPSRFVKVEKRPNFNRMLHRLSQVIASLFLALGQSLKELNCSSEYVIDSFPVAVCRNIRINRCRLLRHEAYRGYNASKREYFYGFKVQVITTAAGLPVEYFIVGSVHDVKAWVEPASGKRGATEAEKFSRTAVLVKAFSYFENSLRTSYKAKSYLQARGLVQAGPGTGGVEVGYHSGAFHQRASSYLQEAALQAGLIYQARGGYSAFARDSVVFPLKNSSGQLSGLYFRLLEEKEGQKHYYLKEREGLYPHYPKAATKKLILTEAIIDAASLLMLEGITREYSILASYGTNGLTTEHILALQALEELEEVIFFYDGDEAGREGSRAVYSPVTAKRGLFTFLRNKLKRKHHRNRNYFYFTIFSFS